MNMNLPVLNNILKKDLRGKRILIRVGFDVPVKKGKVADDSRIVKSLSTIRLLKSKSAKIIILSHLGERKESLKPVANYLSRFLKDFKFTPSILGDLTEKAVSKMKDGNIIMLENLRRDKGEEGNNKNFAKKLAAFGDIYVNEAFSVSHREHASIVGIPKYLPSFSGLLFEKEVKNLERAFKPKHPFLLILGGIKFESKLGVLDRFLKIADKIFIGGALANNFFRLQGMDIGNSLFDKKVSVKKYLKNKKIVLPVDVRKKKSIILDIGPKALQSLFVLVKKSKFILWNGPLGNTDIRSFERGTAMVARKIAENGAISIIGGGDTVAAVEKTGVADRFSFVSTGGGAMLAYLAKGTLPGIEALKKSKSKNL